MCPVGPTLVDHPLPSEPSNTPSWYDVNWKFRTVALISITPGLENRNVVRMSARKASPSRSIAVKKPIPLAVSGPSSTTDVKNTNDHWSLVTSPGGENVATPPGESTRSNIPADAKGSAFTDCTISACVRDSNDAES